jgi:hypothetical protein
MTWSDIKEIKDDFEDDFLFIFLSNNKCCVDSAWCRIKFFKFYSKVSWSVIMSIDFNDNDVSSQ